MAGARGVTELARLQALVAKESSLWLSTLPREQYLQLTDIKWQWVARLRLGMPVPVCEGAVSACDHIEAANEDGWHALNCVQRSSAAITARHNAVLGRLAHFARVVHITSHIEPASLAAEDERRPDIQLDLPDTALLGDVTISHPTAKSWRSLTAARGVEKAVGDARSAEKDDRYADMAAAVDMRFSAVVLYTYGGFHASALSFINQMARAIDPATCLVSPGQWKQSLKEHIAIAVQRGTADIMVRDSQRAYAIAWPRRAARTYHRHRHSGSRRFGGSGRGCGRRGPGSRGPSGEVSLRADSRAAALADRLVNPSVTLTVPSSPGLVEDDCADLDVDSLADTVAMQCHDDLDDPCSSQSVIPETPLIHCDGSGGPSQGAVGSGPTVTVEVRDDADRDGEDLSMELDAREDDSGVVHSDVNIVNTAVLLGRGRGDGARLLGSTADATRGVHFGARNGVNIVDNVSNGNTVRSVDGFGLLEGR
jgi:hypothetical protein